MVMVTLAECCIPPPVPLPEAAALAVTVAVVVPSGGEGTLQHEPAPHPLKAIIIASSTIASTTIAARLVLLLRGRPPISSNPNVPNEVHVVAANSLPELPGGINAAVAPGVVTTSVTSCVLLSPVRFSKGGVNVQAT